MADDKKTPDTKTDEKPTETSVDHKAAESKTGTPAEKTNDEKVTESKPAEAKTTTARSKKTAEKVNPEAIPEGAGNIRNAAFWAESEDGKKFLEGEQARQDAYKAEEKRYADAAKVQVTDPADTDFKESDPNTNDEGHNPAVRVGAAVLPSDQPGVTPVGLSLNPDGTTRPN